MLSAASKVNPSAVKVERLRWREATLSWLIMEALSVYVILNDWKAPALQDLEEETSGTKAWEQEPVWCAPGAGGGPVSRKLTQVRACVWGVGGQQEEILGEPQPGQVHGVGVWKGGGQEFKFYSDHSVESLKEFKQGSNMV